MYHYIKGESAVNRDGRFFVCFLMKQLLIM